MTYRCEWSINSELETAYHDEEWGVPVYDDMKLFEAFTLGGAQAGLSWNTVLKKRDNYRKAFAGFDPKKVAKFDRKKFERLMNDAGIIRNKMKIESTIHNAKQVLKVQKEFGSFSAYVWSFVGGKPIQNRWKAMGELPAETDESNAMSKDMKKRGFKFVGPTICYAVMQGVGMANDHVTKCFRYQQIKKMGKK